MNEFVRCCASTGTTSFFELEELMSFNCDRNVNSTDRQLAFNLEQLEERQMLAGDVSVFLDSGALVIEGDDAGNRVQIVSDGSQITVTGRGTSINGEGSATFSRFSVDAFNIQLADGNDQLTMVAENEFGTGFSSNYSSLIDMGDGNDRVELIANNRGGIGFLSESWDIRTGQGNDRVELQANTQVSDSPTVAVGGFFSTGFDIGQLDIDTSSGNDRFSAEANNGDFTTGFRVASFEVNTSSGNDRVEFSTENVGESTGFQIGFDETDERRSEGQFISNDGWEIRTGDGNDRINVDSNTSGFGTGYQLSEFEFFTGGGSDRVEFDMSNNGRTTGLRSGNGLISTGMDFGNEPLLGGDSNELEESDRDRVVVNASNDGGTGMAVLGSMEIRTGNDRDQVGLSARNSDSSTGLSFGQIDSLGAISRGVSSGLRIDTGRESDRVSLSVRNNGEESTGISASAVIINTSDGDDRIQVRSQNRGDDSTGLRVTSFVDVSMSSGRDDLSISARGDNSLIISNANLDGGSGDRDRLRSNVGLANDVNIIGFEDAPEQQVD